MDLREFISSLLDEDCSDEVIVHAAISQASPGDLGAWASEYVHSLTWSMRRSRVRLAEQATTLADLNAQARQSGYSSWTAMQRDMQAKRAANNAASVADLPALEAMVAAALAPLEALLELEFAVDGSGRRVSWGKATVQDHLDRIRYMQDKSDQILADAAKHQQAVDLLAVTGCLTLSDVRSVVGS